MVDIQPHETLNEHFYDGKPWLVTVDREFNKTVTLDLATFVFGTNPEWFSADGRIILSGIPIRPQAGDTGLYVPAVAAEAYEGILFSAVQKVEGATRSIAPMMTHGAMIDAQSPVDPFPTGGGPALIRHDT